MDVVIRDVEAGDIEQILLAIRSSRIKPNLIVLQEADDKDSIGYIPDHLPLGLAVKRCRKANERKAKMDKRDRRVFCDNTDGRSYVAIDAIDAAAYCKCSVPYVNKLIHTGTRNRAGWKFFRKD